MRSKAIGFIAALVLLSLLPVLAFASGGSEATAASTKEFVDVSHYWTGDIPLNGQFEIVQAKWNEYLKTKLNASMTIKWIEWADWYTKYNLILASGEAVDLFASSSTWLDLWPNAQRGAWLPLDDLLPKYAPTTFSEIPASVWEQAKYNGKIIAIPEDHYTQYVNHGYFYRGDWAKEFGIPNGVITDFAGLERYYQGVKDKKPGVVPWDVAGGGSSQGVEIWGGYVVSTTDAVDPRVYIGNNLAVVWAKSYADKYTLYSPIFDPAFVEFAKMTKRWGDAEYWRKDVLNHTGDTRQLMYAGKSGSDQHHTQTYINAIRPEMDEKQPGSDARFFPFAVTRGNLVGEPITHGATSIGANSKNPERALMIYDLFRSDKYFYQLVNYGIEGTHYIVKDGKRTVTAGFDRDKSGWTANFWGGRVDKFEIPDIRRWSGTADLWASFDKIVKPYPYGRFVFNKTPVEAEIVALSDVANKYFPAIAFGKAGDPVAAVETFRAELKKAGFDKFLAELQKQMTAFQTMMGNK